MTKLTAVELDDLLKSVGFTGDALRKAWAVAMKESGGDPAALNTRNANGTVDHGLFQINSVHIPNVPKWKKILDAKYNASLAYKWSKKGTDWGTWGLGETGWAGSLKKSNPAAWKQTNDAFQRWYDAYPKTITLARQPGAAVFGDIGYGKENQSVLNYQLALRKYMPKKAKRLAPSGATGYFGKETARLTRAAYNTYRRRTGRTLSFVNKERPTNQLLTILGLKDYR